MYLKKPDVTPPSVISTVPATGAAGVAVNIAPDVTFSEPVDPTSITSTLTGGGVTIPCVMNYSGTTASFTPSSSLSKNVLYTARLSAGVKDLAGNPMQDEYFWSFTTGKKELLVCAISYFEDRIQMMACRAPSIQNERYRIVDEQNRDGSILNQR